MSVQTSIMVASTAGTLNYMAPEAVEAGFNPSGEARVSVTVCDGSLPFVPTPADISSLGCVVTRRYIVLNGLRQSTVRTCAGELLKDAGMQ